MAEGYGGNDLEGGIDGNKLGANMGVRCLEVQNE